MYRVGHFCAEKTWSEACVPPSDTLLDSPESMKRVRHCVIPMLDLPEVWFGSARLRYLTVRVRVQWWYRTEVAIDPLYNSLREGCICANTLLGLVVMRYHQHF